MTPILELHNISKGFPGVQALSGIHLSIEHGEIHALLGENGAGKSTLMKILSGIYRPDQGSISVLGQACDFHSYHDAIAAGVGIIFQEFSLIPYLNAVDNIFLGRELTNRFGLLSKPAMREQARAQFVRLGVEMDLDVEICQLSVAQQQCVEIAKALSLNARILILDEPTAALTPQEAGHLFSIMRELKQQGVAMIFISHHMDEIFEICDRITVLRDGRTVGMADVASAEPGQLVEMMVGRKLESNFPPKPAAPAADAAPARVVLDVRAVQVEKNGPVNQFQLFEGEILGFAGLVGSGRTELALAVIGASPAHHKDVWIDGARVALRDSAEALARGIGLLPESRKTEGLILDFSVRDNISINNLAKYQGKLGLINRQTELAATNRMISQVGIKVPGAHTAVGTLSGGNQQKVVIARWLNHHCKVLIFDEPTRGIDVGAKAEIYRLMRSLTEQGYAIILISSELPEIVGMCDRVAVFRQGAISALLTSPSIHASEVMRHATANQH
ncbi:MAG: sugar ABC transporter ATP-binding protein [Pseudomonadota bacterium]